MNQTLRTFAAAHAHLDRNAFLRAVTDPHLLTTSVQTADEGGTMATARIGGWGASDGLGGAPQLIPIRRRPGAESVAGMITLGRAPTCDLVVPHARLSRFQAFFRLVHGTWHVGDACSTNGTTLDEQPVPQSASLPLRPGARLCFAGAVEVVFLDPASVHALLGRFRAVAAPTPPT